MEKHISRRDFILKMGTGTLFFFNALKVASSIEEYAEVSAQGGTPETPDTNALLNAVGAIAAVAALACMDEPEN